MKTLESSHILTRIIRAKRERLQKAKTRVPDVIVKRMAQNAPVVASFSQALESPARVRIIAEVKKASPSKGVFNAHLDPAGLARTYTEAGASAVSVVTEEDFFQGDLSWINLVRKSSPLPVIRKDFVFDSFQVYETKGAGASAILLIAAMLRPDELKELLEIATAAKLDSLVEVHDETELEEALEAGAKIIGVNNRDLKTFNVDLETSLRLASRIPDDRLFVVESGVRTREDIQRLLDVGADAFLVGEHFVTSADPAAAIRGLL
jgi:indole-3-glycerol phosphate synthase